MHGVTLLSPSTCSYRCSSFRSSVMCQGTLPFPGCVTVSWWRWVQQLPGYTRLGRCLDLLFNSAQHCTRHQLIDRFSVKPGRSRRQGRQVGSGRGDLKVGFTDIPTPVNPHWHARGLETWMKAELALFITPSVGT